MVHLNIVITYSSEELIFVVNTLSLSVQIDVISTVVEFKF